MSHMQNQLLAGLGRRAVVVLRAYLRVTNKCTAEAGEGAEWLSTRLRNATFLSLQTHLYSWDQSVPAGFLRRDKRGFS